MSSEHLTSKDKMSAINALRLSCGDADPCDGLTPVNSFRVALNNNFGRKLQRLPEHGYFPERQRRGTCIDVIRKIGSKASYNRHMSRVALENAGERSRSSGNSTASALE